MPFNSPFSTVTEANDVGYPPQHYFERANRPLMSEPYSGAWYTSDNYPHHPSRPTAEGGRIYAPSMRPVPPTAYRPRNSARSATSHTTGFFHPLQKQYPSSATYRTQIHPSIPPQTCTHPAEMAGLSSYSQNLYPVHEPQQVLADVKPIRSQDWATLDLCGDIFNHGPGAATYSNASNWSQCSSDTSSSGYSSWNEMMFSAVDFGSPPYAMPSKPSFPPCASSPGTTPSPCSSPSHRFDSRNHSPLFDNPSPPASCRASVDRPTKGKVCSHCKATSTPLWRREPHTLRPLCNACGLYLQQRNKHRPQELIDADIEDDSTDGSEANLSGPECSHCHTHQTSVWRRSKTGAQLCNACGVYLRLRGKDRPLSLKRNKIKPRSKHAAK